MNKNRRQWAGNIFKREDRLWGTQETLQGKRLRNNSVRQEFQLHIFGQSACFFQVEE